MIAGCLSQSRGLLTLWAVEHGGDTRPLVDPRLRSCACSVRMTFSSCRSRSPTQTVRASRFRGISRKVIRPEVISNQQGSWSLPLLSGTLEDFADLPGRTSSPAPDPILVQSWRFPESASFPRNARYPFQSRHMYSRLVFGRAGSEWPGYTATLNHKTTNFPGLLQDAFEQVEQNHIASIGTQAPEGLFGN